MEKTNSEQKTEKLIEEVYGKDSVPESSKLQINEETPLKKPPIEEQKAMEKNENVLMDFSSTFKQTTKAGKAAKKKKMALAAAKRAAAAQNGDDENSVPQDSTDNVNKDLEDENWIPNDEDLNLDTEAIEAMIPRNLKITQ